MAGKLTPAEAKRRLAAAGEAPALWAMVDQGVLGVGTFVVTIVLSRELSAAEFGAFGIVMGILVAAMTVHTSLIGIPLMVLTARSDRPDQLPVVALALTAATTAAFGLVLAVAVAVLGRPGLLPWVAIALLGGQFQETFRRSLMGRLEFRRAAGGDAMSSLGQAAGVALLASTSRATLGAALVIMGVTSLLAGALQLRQVRPSFTGAALLPEARRPFWRLGRALVLVNGIAAVSIQWLLWTLGALRGVAAVGSFQALLAVVGPTNPLMIAANSVVTTQASRVRHDDALARQRLELDVARRYGLAVAVPLLAYCGVLFAVPGTALRLFFGADSVYRALEPELRLFVFFSVAHYIYFVGAGVLNGRQDTAGLLRAQVAGALVSALAVPMAALWAVSGAVAAAVASAVTRAVVATTRCFPGRR